MIGLQDGDMRTTANGRRRRFVLNVCALKNLSGAHLRFSTCQVSLIPITSKVCSQSRSVHENNNHALQRHGLSPVLIRERAVAVEGMGKDCDRGYWRPPRRRPRNPRIRVPLMNRADVKRNLRCAGYGYGRMRRGRSDPSNRLIRLTPPSELGPPREKRLFFLPATALDRGGAAWVWPSGRGTSCVPWSAPACG